MIACLILTNTILIAQSSSPSTEVSGLEFKVIKCQGERSTNSVKIQVSIQNKEELSLEKVNLSKFTLTDSDGNQYQPLGAYNVRLFKGQGLDWIDYPAGPPVNSEQIIVQRVPSRITYFSQLTMNLKQHPSKGRLQAVVKVENIPIIWK